MAASASAAIRAFDMVRLRSVVAKRRSYKADADWSGGHSRCGDNCSRHVPLQYFFISRYRAFADYAAQLVHGSYEPQFAGQAVNRIHYSSGVFGMLGSSPVWALWRQEV